MLDCHFLQGVAKLGCITGRGGVDMSDYTLNDAKFNPKPLTLFTPDPNYKVDEEKVKRDSKANRESFEKFKKELNRIVS